MADKIVAFFQTKDQAEAARSELREAGYDRDDTKIYAGDGPGFWQEMKEAFGDPHVNSHRKQERKKLAESAGMTGPNAANLFVVGKGVIVGIAYKPDVPGIPFAAAKGEGKTVREYLARAREK